MKQIQIIHHDYQNFTRTILTTFFPTPLNRSTLLLTGTTAEEDHPLFPIIPRNRNQYSVCSIIVQADYERTNESIPLGLLHKCTPYSYCTVN